MGYLLPKYDPHSYRSKCVLRAAVHDRILACVGDADAAVHADHSTGLDIFIAFHTVAMLMLRAVAQKRGKSVVCISAKTQRLKHK